MYKRQGYTLNTVRLAREVSADDFKVAAPGESTACSLKTQTQGFCDIRENTEVHALVIPPFYFSGDIEPITCTLPVRNGFVEPDPATGINKVAIVERHHEMCIRDRVI